MEPLTDTQIKLRIGYALSDRLAPLVSAIQQNIVNSTRMIDDLPSTAIEALLEFSRQQHREDQPRDELGKAYKKVRAAYLEYGEIALREAKARERRLLYGITGFSEHPLDSSTLEDYELQPSRPKSTKESNSV
jgi:hypothetical protein